MLRIGVVAGAAPLAVAAAEVAVAAVVAVAAAAEVAVAAVAAVAAAVEVVAAVEVAATPAAADFAVSYDAVVVAPLAAVVAAPLAAVVAAPLAAAALLPVAVATPTATAAPSPVAASVLMEQPSTLLLDVLLVVECAACLGGLGVRHATSREDGGNIGGKEGTVLLLAKVHALPLFLHPPCWLHTLRSACLCE